MSEALTERRLAAVILGDVVGYSRLMGVDELGTMTALKAHRQQLVLPALASVRGRLVDSAGDSMLMEFGSAVSAVSCAVTIQRGMLARNAGVPPDKQLRFRLGLNLGDIVVDGDKIFGDGVNVAARLESLCEHGGLCLSRSIYEQVRARLPFPFIDDGEHTLKNIAHPVQVYRVSAAFIASLPDPSLPQPSLPAPTLQVARPPLQVQTILKPGVVLNDTYAIDATIGSGGMGEIFRGHEIHSGGGVAIKVIRPDMMDNKVAAALFQKEALVLKDISHEAVVRYYSFSFDPGLRRHYLAMEFVDGPPLPDLLKEGPLAFDAVSKLRRRVAAGLGVAHERGVVHRDVSSDNIIVPHRDVGRAKIIDFGIARAADIGGSTIIGDGFAGKFRYASPEQLGLAGGQVTPLSDIYSFGLVLAEASLGMPLAMGGTQAEVLETRRTVPDLGAIDPRLQPLLRLMLHPDPDRRPQSMQEVADWPADEVGAGTARQTAPLSTGAASIAAQPREPIPALATEIPKPPLERWILGGALGVVLVVGLTIGAYEWSSPGERQHPSLATISTETGPIAETEKGGGSTAATGDPAIGPVSTPDTAKATGETSAALVPIPVPVPVTPQAPTPAQPTAADRILAYISAYAGSGCFLALPVQVTETSAAILGFSEDKDAFQVFDAAFTRDLGFSPAIVGNRIWSKQCPVLDFLRHTDTGAIGPDLFIKNTRIARGQSLIGDVRATDKSLALLMVQEDGVLVDLSKALKDDGDAKTFDIPLQHGSTTGATPQMLVTVASSHPLEALNRPGPQTAAILFPQILQEAQSRGDKLDARAKLFLVTP